MDKIHILEGDVFIKDSVAEEIALIRKGLSVVSGAFDVVPQ
jgi:hypothetical protein